MTYYQVYMILLKNDFAANILTLAYHKRKT